jgi:hypothetical protein
MPNNTKDILGEGAVMAMTRYVVVCWYWLIGPTYISGPLLVVLAIPLTLPPYHPPYLTKLASYALLQDLFPYNGSLLTALIKPK